MLMPYDTSLFFNNMWGESAPKPYLVNYYAAVLSKKIIQTRFIIYTSRYIGRLSHKITQTRFHHIYQYISVAGTAFNLIGVGWGANIFNDAGEV